MRPIPTAPLILSIAGLIPFLWGALTYLNYDLQSWTMARLGSRFIGPYIQVFYGGLILSFMSGVLWGFATRATQPGQAATGYVLSVLPALWAFFTATGGPEAAARNLIYGYLGLLLLDFAFHSWRLAPEWWMRLRLPMTAAVVAALGTGVWL